MIFKLWEKIRFLNSTQSHFYWFDYYPFRLQSMAIGLWRFQKGGTRLERFLPMNHHTQRKLLKFEFWINGELSKSAKIWLSKSIFYVKNHPNFSHFFSSKNTNLGAHFLLLRFFENINFLIITEMVPYFWQLAFYPKLKIKWFPLGMLILLQKSFKFCTPCLKTPHPVLP